MLIFILNISKTIIVYFVIEYNNILSAYKHDVLTIMYTHKTFSEVALTATHGIMYKNGDTENILP